MMEFFAMGGFAAFVWPAWGVAAALLLALAMASSHALRREQRLLAKLQEPGT